MNYILFDDATWHNLLPITYTRPVSAVRCGAYTLGTRWSIHLSADFSNLTQAYLSKVFPTVYKAENIYINASVVPTNALTQAIKTLKPETMLVYGEKIIAIRTTKALSLQEVEQSSFEIIQYENDILKIEQLWEIFQLNGALIKDDFPFLIHNKQAKPVPEYVTIIGDKSLIFISETATVLPCYLNTTDGPIFIDDAATVNEGAMLRGPLFIGEHTTINMGAKLYTNSTIGPHCKVGGELSNVVFLGYSNKGHDGFLGNSVVGEWCNFGADTNCSNLKNNYSNVDIWSEAKKTMIATGAQFCGLIMGDHSKSGINTMFNTGTVVGVSCNIYGAGFPEKHISSFTWGIGAEATDYLFEKAIETANKMMERRGKQLTTEEIEVLKTIYSSKVN